MLIGTETTAPITGIRKDAINMPMPTIIVLKIRTINLS